MREQGNHRPQWIEFLFFEGLEQGEKGNDDEEAAIIPMEIPEGTSVAYTIEAMRVFEGGKKTVE